MSILKSTKTGRSSFEVDLGLTVNWCPRNLGATKPEDCGKYYAWGDDEGYDKNQANAHGIDMYGKEIIPFSEEWYKYKKCSSICSDLSLENDVAHSIMHGDWRMPTKYECTELKHETEHQIEELNGVFGMRFTARNGNSIFIPFSGFIVDGKPDGIGQRFDLWTRTYDIFHNESMYFYCSRSTKNIEIYTTIPEIGSCIRPVCQR